MATDVKLHASSVIDDGFLHTHARVHGVQHVFVNTLRIRLVLFINVIFGAILGVIFVPEIDDFTGAIGIAAAIDVTGIEG